MTQRGRFLGLVVMFPLPIKSLLPQIVGVLGRRTATAAGFFASYSGTSDTCSDLLDIHSISGARTDIRIQAPAWALGINDVARPDEPTRYKYLT